MSCKDIYWSSAYSIGYDIIDDEHRELFKLAQDVIDIEESKEMLVDAIHKLSVYTKTHFKNELEYAKKIHYPDIINHAQLHKDMINNLASFVKNLKDKTIHDIKTYLYEFINDIFLVHILTEDKKIFLYQMNETEIYDSFFWKGEYRLYMEQIDDHHKTIFRYAHSMLKQNVQDRPKFVNDYMKLLGDFLKTHFEEEEIIMHNHNYYDLAHHTQKHKQILKVYKELSTVAPNMRADLFDRRLIEFMHLWIISHICYDDRQFECFVKKEGIEN